MTELATVEPRTWSRRIVAYAEGGHGIHEMHFRADGTVEGWSATPSEAGDGNVDELRAAIATTADQSLAAFDHPPIAEQSLPDFTGMQAYARLELIRAAASSATAAVLHLIEATREPVEDAGIAFDTQETAEHLADALQTVLDTMLADETFPAERREATGQLLGAVRRFIEGWA